MSNSTEKKRPRRPAARRTIPPRESRTESFAREPLSTDSGAPPERASKKPKVKKTARRVSGRPPKRSRARSRGDEPARGFEERPGRGETGKEHFPPTSPGAGNGRATEPADRGGVFPHPFRSEQAEDSGVDPVLAARMAPLFELLYRKYFQVRAIGLEKIPFSGAVVLACNHAGPVPWDGVILKTAMQIEDCPRRDLRWLVGDDILRLPFLGPFLRCIGAVSTSRKTAEQVLSAGEVLAVFPEDLGAGGGTENDGDAGERLGSTGYIEVALRAAAPLLPVAMVSADDSYPLLDKVKELHALLGLPFSPLLQRLPWLDPSGLFPLPGRWRVAVGESLEEMKGSGRADADDPLLVRRIDEQARYVVKELFYVARAALQEI
jgi:1-acyl-sn-glycerol-3-phosphate acyltransferase